MAKEKAPTEFVETSQNNNFADPIRKPLPRSRVPAGEDKSVEESMATIRERRDALRRTRGREGKRRKITHYHDAERLANLKALGHDLISNEELVDCEEEGLLPSPDPHTLKAKAEAGVDDDLPPDEPEVG